MYNTIEVIILDIKSANNIQKSQNSANKQANKRKIKSVEGEV